MLRNLSEGEPACLTATHLDSLVLARCGFNHSADYRSVMAFGHARLIEDLAEKERALVMMVDRFFPGRTATLASEHRAGDQGDRGRHDGDRAASAKIRSKGVADDEEDYAFPTYAERLPILTLIGRPEPCPRLGEKAARPDHLRSYREGRPLEDALREAHLEAYPSMPE